MKYKPSEEVTKCPNCTTGGIKNGRHIANFPFFPTPEEKQCEADYKEQMAILEDDNVIEEESWIKELKTAIKIFKVDGLTEHQLFLYIKDTLFHLREKDKEGILKMVSDEIAIAHTKDAGGKTSRLTSLYIRISKLNKKE